MMTGGSASSSRSQDVGKFPTDHTKKNPFAEKLNDRLEDLLHRLDELEADRLRTCENVALNEANDSDEEKEEYDLLLVSKEIEDVKQRGELDVVDTDLIVSFVKHLFTKMKVCESSQAWALALQHAKALLDIITTEGLDQKVVSGEALEQVINLCKTLIQEVLFPFVDKGYTFKLTGHGSGGATKTAKKKAPGKPLKKASKDSTKKPKSSRKSKKRSRRVRYEEDDDFENEQEEDDDDSQSKATRQVMEEEEEDEDKPHTVALNLQTGSQLLSGVANVLLLVELAITNIKNIEDQVLIQVASMCCSTLLVEPIGSFSNKTLQVQQINLDILRCMFRRYHEHRSVIIAELIDAIPRLTNGSGNRASKTYKIEGVQESVQPITATILELIQCSCEKDGNGLPDLQPALQIGRDFLVKLLDYCGTPPDYMEDDTVKQYQRFLEHFVNDLLVLQSLPEWPAAETILKQMSTILVTVLVKQNSSSKGIGSKAHTAARNRFCNQSLALIGRILARIQMDLTCLQGNHLVLPQRNQQDMEEKTGGPILCPICGEESSANELNELNDEEEDQDVVRCMDCSRFFHSDCLAFTESYKLFCCDDCVILAQLEMIRKSGTLANCKYGDDGNSTAQQGNDKGMDLDGLRDFRQLCLNFLALENVGEGSSVAGHAYEFHIAQWAKTDQKNDLATKTHPLLEEQYRKRQEIGQELVSKRASSGRFSVSRETIIAIMKHLASSMGGSGLCTEEASETLLSRLLLILGTGNPTFRARAIKALVTVVESNPDLLTRDKVRMAVEQRIMDEATSVRDAAIELVGKHILAKPELIAVYQSMLAHRINDKGLSVRKRVVKTLRDVLLLHGKEITTEARTGIYKHLVDRILDPQEEDTVKDLIVSMFRDLWFTEGKAALVLRRSASERSIASGTPKLFRTPSTRKNKNNNQERANGNEPTPIPFPLSQTPMQAVRGTPSLRRLPSNKSLLKEVELLSDDDYDDDDEEEEDGTKRNDRTSPKNQSKHQETARNAQDIMEMVGEGDEESTIWITTLLKGVLGGGGDNESQEDMESNALIQKKRANVRRICIDLVKSLVDKILELQDDECKMTYVDSQGKIRMVDIQGMTMRALRTIHMFGNVCPELLVPYIETLALYLSPNGLDIKKENRLETNCMLLGMLCHALQATINVGDALIDMLQKELQAMVFREAPEVMLLAIQCLGIIASHITHSDDALRLILIKFVEFLAKLNGRPGNVSNIQRAVLCCGAIPLAMGNVQSNDTVEHCFQLILAHVGEAHPKGTRAVAMQALGLLLTKYNHLMLRQETDQAITNALTKDPEPSVRAQTLISLYELMENNEKRLEAGLAKKELEKTSSKAARVYGDQDADSSLLASLIQKHAQEGVELLFHETGKVRVQAVVLVGTMLKQGLVNPLQCIEPMVALLTDEKWIVHQTAHEFLVELDERHPEFLVTRALQGMIKGYTLAKPQNCPAIVTDEHFHVGALQPSFSIYSRLYRSCLAKNSATRIKFLHQAISMFLPDASLFHRADDTQNRADASSTSEDVSEQSPVEGDQEEGEEEEEEPQQAGRKRKTMSSSSFTPRRPEYSLRLLQYIGKTLATLPYTLVEEPLYLIYQISRITSLYGESVVDAVKEAFRKHKDGSATVQFEDFHKACKIAQQMVILFELKNYLKSVYHLSDARCQAFNPNQLGVIEKSERSLSSLPTALPPFDPLDEETLSIFDKEGPSTTKVEELSEIYTPSYSVFKELLNTDPEDINFTNTPAPKRSAKKRRKLEQQQQLEQETEQQETPLP